MSNMKNYKEEAQQAVDKLFTEIEDLKRKGESVNDETKKRINDKISQLNDKKQTLQKKYDELSEASADASEEVKKGFEDAKDSFTNAWSKVKEELPV